METTRLPSIISNPQSNIRHSVIWLHGLGASGNDFSPIVPELGVQEEFGVRFVFPNAPQIPVTINNGMVMPAWYDISEMDLMRRADADGIAESSKVITEMINDEIEAGVPASNIILAGFSQGGVIALEAGLRFPQPLAGVMALSTYMPLADQFPNADTSGNGGVSIFYGHGEYDPVIPIAQAEAAQQFLNTAGYQTDYKRYPMEHSVCPEEIGDIKNWLLSVFS
ncbi:MAG: carboxylesterase [Cycloclasticus sp. symbiont of Poecilosclerida sp. M]|nr:MAG: carboxylesterase [Cycloclasticus sp. symbiont of Poecilosclerida sp. M]